MSRQFSLFDAPSPRPQRPWHHRAPARPSLAEIRRAEQARRPPTTPDDYAGLFECELAPFTGPEFDAVSAAMTFEDLVDGIMARHGFA